MELTVTILGVPLQMRKVGADCCLMTIVYLLRALIKVLHQDNPRFIFIQCSVQIWPEMLTVSSPLSSSSLASPAKRSSGSGTLDSTPTLPSSHQLISAFTPPSPPQHRLSQSPRKSPDLPRRPESQKEKGDLISELSTCSTNRTSASVQPQEEMSGPLGGGGGNNSPEKRRADRCSPDHQSGNVGASSASSHLLRQSVPLPSCDDGGPAMIASSSAYNPSAPRLESCHQVGPASSLLSSFSLPFSSPLR